MITYERLDNGIKVRSGDHTTEVVFISDTIVKCFRTSRSS